MVAIGHCHQTDLWQPRRVRPVAVRRVSRQPLILVIHTDVWARGVLRNLLCSAGWATEQVSNGWSGLRMAIDLEPDLVLIGPELSELCPGELITALRCNPKTRSVPV